MIIGNLLVLVFKFVFDLINIKFFFELKENILLLMNIFRLGLKL